MLAAARPFWSELRHSALDEADRVAGRVLQERHPFLFAGRAELAGARRHGPVPASRSLRRPWSATRRNRRRYPRHRDRRSPACTPPVKNSRTAADEDEGDAGRIEARMQRQVRAVAPEVEGFVEVAAGSERDLPETGRAIGRTGHGSDGEAGPAAAGCNGVRVPDLERLAHQIVDEIDHRAAHIDQRQIVDQHRRAVLLDGDVVVVAAVDQIELVGKAGAAAALDRNAQRDLAGLAGDDLRDAAWQRRRSRRPSWQSWRQRPCGVTLLSRSHHRYEAGGGKSTGGACGWTRRTSLATSASATARARPMPAIRRCRAAASRPRPKARPARRSSATATASSIRPPSAG